MLDIRIFQINLDKDKQHHAFKPLADIVGEKYEGEYPEIDASNYSLVFEDKVVCNTLEDIFSLFNYNMPCGYSGRSMSVSDIVQIIGSNEQVECGCYYCDDVGFKRVLFSETSASVLMQGVAKVVLVEPHKEAKIITMNTAVAEIEKYVGTDIETFDYRDVCIICDFAAKIKGQDENRKLIGDTGEVLEILSGTFIICNVENDTVQSLTNRQAEYYRKLFEYPPATYKHQIIPAS